LSGGAWLKTESRSAQVGVGAKLAAPRWYARKRRKYVYGDGEKPRPLATSSECRNLQSNNRPTISKSSPAQRSPIARSGPSLVRIL
jgi:hypothetical protein